MRPACQTVDGAIAAVAAKQLGSITQKQLFELGLNKHDVFYRVKIGRLFRVYPRVYSVGHPPITPLEWASAAVLACGSGAALSHGSAMVSGGIGGTGAGRMR